ncbi:RsmB/NOP family class I SAM-dependent RNA methyltransferase [Salinarimonas ramus]|uniref:MFS transporter n=1 Tax=Salinarimonas ramus TaxID=690164 RepID=A0A917Q537_9HYPH|nr:RsmB/NOP family class I SAM-dependent RNA methyltransferase [Salinarimonas ramus]GGK23915.1 MFS transporter [Salinarimonas ramus]
MTPNARLSAAMEVLDDLLARRRPAADALKDWGLSHRFAGSKDRAAIATLVYDALRRRASAAWIMGERGEAPETGRALVLGMLALQRGLAVDAISAMCDGSRFAPAPLSEDERARLAHPDLADAPAHVQGDYPEWIEGELAAVFGEELVAEARALSERAPLDIRVNTLLANREEVQNALAFLSPVETPLAPHGLRIGLGDDGRGPALQSEPEFLKGFFEIQDEGSQLAALLAAPGEKAQVVDLCAGAGGKTLALSAAMENAGQIYATDSDTRRLAPIHERLARAGVRNVQIRSPRGKADAVEDLDGRADLVLVDAPCTGTGTWRRNPDAKWRLRPGSLAQRKGEQETVLDRAARLVKPGGRIVYVTCSVLPAENDEAVSAFLGRHAGFSPVPAADLLAQAGLGALSSHVRETRHGLQMSPSRTGVDGFYVAALKKTDARYAMT